MQTMHEMITRPTLGLEAPGRRRVPRRPGGLEAVADVRARSPAAASGRAAAAPDPDRQLAALGKGNDVLAR